MAKKPSQGNDQDEASCKILHASYDRIDHEEHATIVLNNFETNGEWKEFTGKSKLATVYSNVFYVLEFVTGKLHQSLDNDLIMT